MVVRRPPQGGLYIGKTIMITRTAQPRQAMLPFAAPLDQHTRQTTVVVLSNSHAIYRGLQHQLPAWNVKVTNNPVEFGMLVERYRPAVVVVDRDVVVDGKPHEELLEPTRWHEINTRIIAIQRPDCRLNLRYYDVVYITEPGVNEVPGLATRIMQTASTPP